MNYSTNYADLLRRQRELQVLGNMPLPSLDQVRVALLAELGELAQELKPMWAWWSKPEIQKVVNTDRVMSEAADVLHFILLLDLVALGGKPRGEIKPWANQISIETDLFDVSSVLHDSDPYDAVRSLCSVVAHFGFTPQDLAHAYWTKSEENLRRWAEAAQNV